MRYLLLSWLLLLWVQLPGQARLPKLILDADTGNELDDLFAIAGLLASEQYEVVGLTAAHWNHYGACGRETLAESQALNEALAEWCGQPDLPVLPGAKGRLFRADLDAGQTAAVQFIIAQARALPPGDSLLVVTLGPATNLAAAIQQAPEIAPRLRAYCILAKYHFDRQAWNKNEFNATNDLGALGVLFEAKDLPLTILPANVAQPLVFDYVDTRRRLEGLGLLGKSLLARWDTHAPEDSQRIMWDVAMTQLLDQPELGTRVQVMGPPEHGSRPVGLFSQIEVDALREAYWQQMEEKYGEK